MNISKKFLFQQKTMLFFVGRTFLQAIFPFLKLDYKGELGLETTTVKPPSKKLLNAYSRWSGVKEERYEGLPSHMFSQYALSFGLELLRKLNYPLEKIINQGVDVRTFDDISGKLPIHLQTEIVNVVEDDGKVSVHQRMEIYENEGKVCIEINLYTAFILRRGKKKSKLKKDIVETEYTLIKEWSASESAGLEFGILTGDLNPLHWVKFIAKATPFRGIILHGLGMYAKVYEILQNNFDNRLKEMNVKFIKPLKLPSEGLKVEVSNEKDENGFYQLLLKNSREENLMVGTFLI